MCGGDPHPPKVFGRDEGSIQLAAPASEEGRRDGVLSRVRIDVEGGNLQGLKADTRRRPLDRYKSSVQMAPGRPLCLVQRL
jgi:hypothetical protein